MKKAPDLNSILKDELQEYIDFMVGNGRSFRVDTTILKEFDRFLQTRKDQNIDAALVDDFVRIKLHITDGQYENRHRIIRKFLDYRAIRGRGESVPIHPKVRIGGRRIPHIYSEADMAHLISHAGKLKPFDSLRSHTYQAIIGLLACTGMRISEALNLDVEDVDLENDILYIRNTKFKKSRYVPIHATASMALKQYAIHRAKYFPDNRDSAFFLSTLGDAVKYTAFNETFAKMIRELNIGGESHNARIHDLRHTFAVNRMLAWYEEGVDIRDMLQILSTYMGHTNFENTTYYLNASSVLMEKGAAAFKFSGRGEENA